MALDELRENDLVYDIAGFKYVVDKEFMEQAKPIKVDFTSRGFKVDSSIEIGGGSSSSCGSCGSGGTCG